MSDAPGRARFSLSRWSQRKLAARTAGAVAPAPAAVAPGAAAAAPLPSVDSLGFDSDFTVFLRPEVDETLKRAALKRLFRDPRFNVMDGLDTYIDDYTQPDPIEPGLLADLLQRGFGPPADASAAGEGPAAAAASPSPPPAVSACAPSGPSARTSDDAAAAGEGRASDPNAAGEHAHDEGR